MNIIKDLWEEIDQNYERLGLNENPFSESADFSSEQKIQEIFTGRRKELIRVLSLFKGTSRKRIMVYGWWGIGKTTFMKLALESLKSKFKKIIATYISLPPETDIATASLIALALEMPNDEWAQQQLYLMGITPDRRIYKGKEKVELNVLGIKGSTEKETMLHNKPQYPSISFEKLCERALTKHDKVVICIDDLDKQNPDKVKTLLRDAQGVLKGKAWFILSGHPGGLTKDMISGNMGLFDLTQELKQMDEETTYQMLIRYLNFARSSSSKYCSIHPFTEETARLLCKYSEGHPRWFNRLATYILMEALDQKASLIDLDLFENGRKRTRNELQSQQELTDRDLYLFNIVEEKGILSDENISMEDLNKLGITTFNDIMPRLEKLVQNDLLRQIHSEDQLKYVISPIMK
ncbi:AAA+ ATPase domain-containing protein [Candidatus Magnetomoraceae bacterium gMMP-1]